LRPLSVLSLLSHIAYEIIKFFTIFLFKNIVTILYEDVVLLVEDIYMNGIIDVEDDRGFLKRFEKYDSNEIHKITYVYERNDSSNFDKICDFFNLNSIAGKGTELKKLTNLRHWVYTMFQGRGDHTICAPKESRKHWNIFTINENMMRSPFTADCGTIALIMTEVLLSMGWKARWIQCLPLDLRQNESHCVTHVWSEEYNKWIIIDAAQDVFYFNSKAIPYGLPDLRDAIINNDRILIYSTAEKQKGMLWLKQYWVKNIFRFHTLGFSGFDMFSLEKQEHYYLNPLGYELSDKIVKDEQNIDIHINTHNYEEFWEIK